jgi:hypothetical protein
MPDTWTNEQLEAMRRIGDETVDPLALKIISGDGSFDRAAGRFAYHKLLGLADLLLEAPELLLLDDAEVGKALKSFDARERDYFDPMPVPEWVDTKRLERASQIWDENMLAIIGVLYAASLPSCYLIANGIPTLYDTGKLGKREFIYQRIYETGLMLDAVMEPKGLHVFSDIPGPDGRPARRYVWGRGFIAARKVRLLHASMRCMLLFPELLGERQAHDSPEFAATSLGALTSGRQPYDCAKLGVPVNQEDLAYTLLTFGYTIPLGLKKWGCRLSDEDCEAFLHAWCLVGHIMGVRDELLPDDVAAAKRYYEQVKSRQARASVQGPELTRVLEGFLANYLPGWMKQDVPWRLITTQLSRDEAAMIDPEPERRRGLILRVLVPVGFAVLWLYYLIKSVLIRRVPPLRHALGRSFAIAGEALIDSWRDGYQRRPFWIPGSVSGGWQRQEGMDPAMEQLVQAWRQSLFTTVILGVALVITGMLLVVAGLVALFFAFKLPQWLLVFLPCAIIACWAMAFTTLTWSVQRVVAKRPGPQAPRNPDLR